MQRKEYEKELIRLYGMAIEQQDVRLALTILETSRVTGLEDIKGEKE